MSNNKQSSVEWLAEIIRFANKELYAEMFDEIEQAKAMHKEEHGQTWDKSMENFEARGRNEIRAWVDFDEYYKETFGEWKPL